MVFVEDLCCTIMSIVDHGDLAILWLVTPLHILSQQPSLRGVLEST